MRSANKPDTETSDLDWLVNDFVRATPRAAHAIVVSSDIRLLERLLEGLHKI